MNDVKAVRHDDCYYLDISPRAELPSTTPPVYYSGVNIGDFSKNQPLHSSDGRFLGCTLKSSCSGTCSLESLRK